MPRLRGHASQAKQLGAQFKPFAERLRQLVEAFDEDQISVLIEQRSAKNKFTP